MPIFFSLWDIGSGIPGHQIVIGANFTSCIISTCILVPSPTKISAIALHLIAPGWFIFYIVFVIFDLLVMNLVIRSIKIVFFV